MLRTQILTKDGHQSEKAKRFSTKEEKFQAILKHLELIRPIGQPILIGTSHIEDSYHLSKLFEERSWAHDVLNANEGADEAHIISRAGTAGQITIATNMAGRGTDIKLDAKAIELGGLHVVACQFHNSSRVDRQLYGRCARQGDPGSVVTFYSLEDELFRQNLNPIMLRALRSKPFSMFSPLFRLLCQKRAEDKARYTRMNVLRHDQWLQDHLPNS